jgi:hypothetical protein
MALCRELTGFSCSGRVVILLHSANDAEITAAIPAGNAATLAGW